MTSVWDERIRRALELKQEHSFAREVLEFYSTVAEFQRDLQASTGSEAVQDGRPERESRVRARPPGPPPLPAFWQDRFQSFVVLIEQAGTPELAALSRRLRQMKTGETWGAILESYWRREWDPRDFDAGPALSFFPKAFLQPFAERLAANDENVEAGATWHVREGGRAACPVCGHPPQLGVLRPEGAGARRSLLCSLCAREWRYKRVCCPACGEEAFAKLAYSRATEFPHIRLDLCETCGGYLKSIDQSVDGRAVPIVDEIAALPLDLWALEQGYSKIELNLVGI